MSVVYLDASALSKLILDEAESAALRNWIEGYDLITNDIGWTECMRAVRRFNADPDSAEAELRKVVTMTIDSVLVRHAAMLDPTTLRMLDAFHVASALRLRTQLEAFVCYDNRLAEAARAYEIPVEAPA